MFIPTNDLTNKLRQFAASMKEVRHGLYPIFDMKEQTVSFSKDNMFITYGKEPGRAQGALI